MLISKDTWQRIRSNPEEFTNEQLTSIELHCFTQLTSMVLQSQHADKSVTIKEVGTIMRTFKSAAQEQAWRDGRV